MTEPAAPNPLPPRAAPAEPVLVHSGVYTLWQTPEGGRLLAFKRLHTVDPHTGAVVDIHNPADERLPHVPAEALPLLSMWLENGFPPAILAMMRSGRANPAALLKQLRELAGATAAPAGEGADGAT
jgi:hypothetical protein